MRSRAPSGHSMVPLSGRKMPVIMRMVVVFPAPLRPRRPVMVPRFTANETPSTARTVAKDLVMSRTERTSGMPGDCTWIATPGSQRDTAAHSDNCFNRQGVLRQRNLLFDVVERGNHMFCDLNKSLDELDRTSGTVISPRYR